MHIPRRMICFDSESQVNIPITDDEVYRTIEGEKVVKYHTPYLICSRTYAIHERGHAPRRSKKTYHPKHIEGVGEFPQGSETFLKDFWVDVDEFAKVGEYTYLFAHNAKYDVQVTGGVKYLVQDMGYEVIGYNDSNPFILRLEKIDRTVKRFNKKLGREYDHTYKKTINILSSTNYYQEPLAKLAEVFNLKKLDFDHDQAFTLPDAITYCEGDTEILETAMLAFINFIQRENLGSFAMTIAGQAFGAFRHRFMQDTTIWIHDDKEALRIERDAYAGGRTECFYMGEVPGVVKYVDVNSMYPYVMDRYLYPVKLYTRWTSATVEQLKTKIQEGYLVCAEVRVNTEFPVYHKKQKRLIFPTGDFWTTLSTPEIIYGLDRGLIIEVGAVSLYEAGYIFQEFVPYFYKMRMDARKIKDKVHDKLGKNIMNNLYGKFGQKNHDWTEVGKADPTEVAQYTVYKRQEGIIETLRIFGGKIWKRNDDVNDEEAYNSFPAIAAHVTAYARMLLLQYIECAGWKNVYYCDTDSLFVNHTGYTNLEKAGFLNNDVLGLLKLEDEGKLTLFGCKDYTFNEAVKIKGVSKSARSLPPDKDGRLRFAVTQWGGFSERFKTKNFTDYYNTVLVKTLKREYLKADVDESTVTPYRLDYEKESKEAYQLFLRETSQDLFITDPIKYHCNQHGHLKCPNKGEYFFHEYKRLPFASRVKYFRRNEGLTIDVWCQGVGWSVNDLFDLLHDHQLKKIK